MSLTIIILLSIYFIVNSFVAGAEYEYRDEMETIDIIWIVALVLFAIPIYLFTFIAVVAAFLWDRIDSRLQISFWFNFYFTKKFYNMEPEQLERFHNRMTTLEMGLLRGSRSRFKKKCAEAFIKCAKAVLKRNNYVH